MYVKRFHGVLSRRGVKQPLLPVISIKKLYKGSFVVGTCQWNGCHF